MTIEQRASEQVARLVVGQPTPHINHVLMMMQAVDPPDGATISDHQRCAQLAAYAVKLERLAVALAAEVIRQEDARISVESIPDALGKEGA